VKAEPPTLIPAEDNSANQSSFGLAATSVVCGTDFSCSATEAVDVAGSLVNQLGGELVLAHAVNPNAEIALPEKLNDSLCLYARAQLHEERERLDTANVKTVEVFRAGNPEQILLEEINTHQARLLVMAGGHRRGVSQWIRGTLVERVAEAAPVPTLVVRDAKPLLRWLQGRRRLRVFVCADFSAPSAAALEWANGLRHLGACDVTVIYLESAPSVYPVFDRYSRLMVSEMALDVARSQERNFRRHVRSILGNLNVKVRFEYHWARSDAHLLEMAAEGRADLVVVGTHGRVGWRRLGHHSVSRGVLRYAKQNVVCVPSYIEAGSAFSS
jgi:nucleotide-binding universal stress UspA family protein